MNLLSWDDFQKLDIRCGTILEVSEFKEAKKAAWKLKIDFGPLGIKKSSAQITELYSKEGLIGKQIIAIVNFPPKQIANYFSECLVLGISNQDNQIVLLQPEQEVPNGNKIH